MPHRFNHLADQGILAIAFFGLVTMAERIEALRLLVHEHELTGDYRLLADFRQANVVPELPAETDAHAERLAREPALHRFRIALVGERGRIRSIEYMAALRGYFFERFTSSDEAMRWLASQHVNK